MDIDKIVDDKITADAEFQATLKDLSDADKNTRIAEKRKEVTKSEFASLSEKAKKDKEVADNYKIRAEKAEGKVKVESTDKKDGDLSVKDLYALTNAKVPEEDITEVAEYAKLKNISIAEALKSSIVKGILAEKAETRKTAEATRTQSTRGTVKTDGDTIVSDIKSRGEDAIPDPKSEGAEALFWARRGRKPQ